jgi:DNA polymerase III epsilon subunit-like protein
MKKPHPDIASYICVDIEASGPNPGCYSMLSIGACTVAKPHQKFYVEIKPLTNSFTPEAMSIHGLSLEKLSREGLPPAEAMKRFETWISGIPPVGVNPVFVAFNAPFDWMFVNDYFHRFLGRNPFGHKAVDIKAFFMGLHGVPWEETSHRMISRWYLHVDELTHHALQDAIDEAEIFYAMHLDWESNKDLRTDL